VIDRELLDILACPVCKAPLVEEGQEKLRCTSCRRLYPIRDGIPILLAEEAENG
jgi:uncharacterized protein YbaR (Trm112 family)